MPEIKIILPFPLPTWNRILSMSLKERMRLKKWIKGAVSTCILEGIGWQTKTISRERLALMGYDVAVYFAMIRPNTSNQSLLPKKRSRWTGKKARK
jgi:hypothetical protein